MQMETQQPARSRLASLSGHYWSFQPLASWLLRPQPLPPSQPFSTTLVDPQLGLVRLTGALSCQTAGRQRADGDTFRKRGAGGPDARPQQSDTVVVALHGLGGDIHSHYIERTALAAAALGLDCLRLNMRGADMLGEDLYHAGLTADLQAAINSEALARYRRVLVVGFSLGGHLALRYAIENNAGGRLCAVAAVCPPLDLSASVVDIDSPLRWPYRRYVLASLRAMLRSVAARRALPIPLEEAMRIKRVRDWDEQLVAPRFGFTSAQDYYQRTAAVHHLDKLEVPTLLLLSRHDPMVLTSTTTRTLPPLANNVSLRIVDRAGHVGFPSNATLGFDGPLGMEAQLLCWLRNAVEQSS